MSLPARAGWIGGPRWDVAFFFLPALLALALAGLALDRPWLAIALWWAWIVFLDGPHLLATLSRTWAYPQERARFARVHRRAWLAFLPGLLAWAIGALSGSLIAFDLFLLTTTIWSIHHNVRQHYGIMAIYQWHARQPGRWARLDKWALYGSMWGLFGLFLVGHPFNREVLGIPESAWGQLGAAAHVMGVGFALLGAGYFGSIVWRARQKIAIKPALFVLIPVVGVQALAYGWIGRFEPLMTPKHPEQAFLLVSFVMGLIHSVEYLGIVLVAQARRFERRGHDDPAASRVRLLGRQGWHYLAMLGASALLYLALNAARGAAPGVAWFGEQSHGARLFMALYWGVFFHHYYVDQHIWRVSSDDELRQDLGLNKA